MEITQIMTSQNKPLVSVIITFLNEEKFLEEAIKSVLHQQYTNWNLLLIDNGATDKSTDIALRYAFTGQGKITYYEHRSYGDKRLTPRRHHVVKKATGDLIAYLNAGDVWLPGKLSEQVEIFLQNPGIGMVAEASDYWYAWEDQSYANIKVTVGVNQDKVYTPPQLLSALYPLGKGAAPRPSSLMVTKEAIEKAGNFEDLFLNELPVYEYQAFLSMIFLHEKVFISSACNNLYRQRQGSPGSMVFTGAEHHRVHAAFLQWLQGQVLKNKISDLPLWRLIRKAGFFYRHPALNFFWNTIPGKIVRLVKQIVPGSKPQHNLIPEAM